MKAFHDVSSQDELIFKAEYYRNKIDNHITDFITQMKKGKKGWLSHKSVVTLYQMTTTKRVINLLNITENKDFETCDQIIIF